MRTVLTILTTLVASAIALSYNYPQVEIDAIRRGGLDRWSMKVKYGPNNLGWFGKYAYIWTEIDGPEIEEGAVVATYAKINDVDYTFMRGNQTFTHFANDDVEMAECAVVYSRFREDWEMPEYKVRTYKGTNRFGYAEINGMTNVWTSGSSFYDTLYGQSSSFDKSRVTCYMERSASNWASSFELKNNVAFTGVVGHNMYDSNSYNIEYNSYMDTQKSGWDAIYPRFSSESYREVEFKWWNIEGAEKLAAGVVAVWALLI